MNIINKIFRPFNIQLNNITALKHQTDGYKTMIECVFQFYQDAFTGRHLSINKDISGIVFSKNRAMQLHALISSYFHYTKNYVPLTVLFTYSDEQHKISYEILQRELSAFPVTFIYETNFSLQLKEIVSNTHADRIFFMTDDAVFLDHYNLSDCLDFDPTKNIFSLRLGADFDFCYSYNRKQAVPAFSPININGKNLVGWIWENMTESPDWIYPLSVDATIFLKKEIELLLYHISFKSPNSLESQLQPYTKFFVQRRGICYPKVKYVNVPCNIVQTEYNNITTGTFSTSELLEKFLRGQRIDWKKLEKFNARDAQIVKFSFV